MKKLIMPVSNQEMMKAAFEQGLDIAVVGLNGYSCRFDDYYDIKQLEEAIALKDLHQKQLFISLNDFYFEQQLEALSHLVEQLCKMKIDGIIFHDLALLSYAKQFKADFLMCYHPDTLNTHSQLSEFWMQAGIDILFIAKEIPLLEQLAIAATSKLPTMIQIHGRSHLFHSKRPLVSTFLDFIDGDETKTELSIHEKLSDKSSYVLQESSGTHIFTEQQLIALTEMETIKSSSLSYLYIESISTPHATVLDTVASYHKVIQNDFSQSDMIDIETTFIENHPMIPYYKGYFYDQTVFTVDQARKREENESKYFKSR